jgi:uncharacterized membrane protein
VAYRGGAGGGPPRAPEGGGRQNGHQSTGARERFFSIGLLEPAGTISIRNPRALFVNCNNHSLNLAGLHAAKQDPVVVTFFGTVENLYVFFSASTVRWEKMRERLEITLKRECQTR